MVLKIIKIFITSNNKQIGKILFDCDTIEEDRIVGHISDWTHFGWVTIAFGKFTSTQLLPNTSMMASKIFD